jgi:hypothetical protein
MTRTFMRTTTTTTRPRSRRDASPCPRTEKTAAATLGIRIMRDTPDILGSVIITTIATYTGR